MQDKKQSLAILIIILIVITYFQYISAQDQRKRALQKQAQNHLKQAELQQRQEITHTASANNTGSAGNQLSVNNSQLSNNNLSVTSAPTLEQLNLSNKTIFSNGSLKIIFNHLGARIQSLELNGIHKDLSKTELYNLIKLEDKFPLPVGINFSAGSDESVSYSLESVQGALNNSGIFETNAAESNLKFSAKLSDNSILTKTYSFKQNSYLFKVSAEIQGRQNSAIELKWPIHVKKEDLEQRYDPYFFSLLTPDNKVSHTQALSSLDEIKKNQTANWLSFGDRYFMTALLPSTPLSSTNEKILRVDSSDQLFTLVSRASGNMIEASVYAGPKNYESLKVYGSSLERSIDLGFVSFISYPLLQLLRWLFSIFGNYGVAIVALTLIVKNALYPLNKASLTSMKGMQEIAPEINSLRERIKDPTQLNKEIFALYKRKGVNPMGGCLPIAIQIPVFFGLYSALQNAVELRHAPFGLWVKDLATPEKLSLIGINVPVMVIAMGVIMFIQQYRTPMPNVEPAQRKMVLSMSVIFTLMFLIFPFPAGLALYMLVNTIISLVQQQSIKSEKLNHPFKVTLLASFAILAVSMAVTKL